MKQGLNLFPRLLLAVVLIMGTIVPNLGTADTGVYPIINSQGSLNNFAGGETVSVSATTSSSSATFTLTAAINSPDVLVENAGSNTAFVGCGVGAQTAHVPGAGALNSTPVLAGAVMVLRKGIGSTVCAAITATSTTTIYFTAGNGQ